ncbi:hypothetical protein PNK_1912 [Candidatus Protochlamydia naegleriophila]|uniref:Uncharacterized protein n=1 Tax=Candidatus Protochlamydia naegleriophila TaxID=389348 RepID=A0A0U5JEH2_9BACT|nr:hypothetical protein [Candidatus Protochlamydia naegleriophila]CUI17517.1 hypothetical protein PNK_1912 [Candidatus Protochlamydia naegleriophila]
MGFTIQPVDLLSRPSFKPVKLIPCQSKETWLDKHIEWLRSQESRLQTIKSVCLVVLEILALTLSLIGVVPLIWGIRAWQKQENKAKFFKMAEQARRPLPEPISIKTSRSTFNHIHDFAIEGGIIWCRLHNNIEGEWRPIYFDGYPDEIPEAIASDGANLIVVDQNRYVHYKKVLREFRYDEINEVNRHRIENGNVDLAQDPYIAIDKAERANWKDKWCSLPYWNAHFFVNLLTGKRLKLPNWIKSWAISHRGLYNNHIDDRLHQQHRTDGGTTTLYGLHQNGRDIFEYDPWSPQLAQMSLALPESANKIFEADEICASSSTIMTIGYERIRGEDRGLLQVLTWMADLDTTGWNPFFKYNYSAQPEPNAWAIPFPAWQTHPIELDEHSFITKEMSILQTGEGNNARELRIVGVKQGQAGIYYKKINEPEWSFIANLAGERVAVQEAVPGFKVFDTPFETTVHDYRASRMSFEAQPDAPLSSHLYGFGKRSIQSRLELVVRENVYSLDLFRKKTLLNFFGVGGDSFELVVPDELLEQEEIRQLFGGQKVIKVDMRESEGRVEMTSKGNVFFKLAFEEWTG